MIVSGSVIIDPDVNATVVAMMQMLMLAPEEQAAVFAFFAGRDCIFVIARSCRYAFWAKETAVHHSHFVHVQFHRIHILLPSWRHFYFCQSCFAHDTYTYALKKEDGSGYRNKI